MGSLLKLLTQIYSLISDTIIQFNTSS